MSIFCILCGEDDTRVLKERHHVFGKAIGQETIVLCHNCHDKVTATQNQFPPMARKKDSPQILRKAYALRTFGSMFEVFGKNLVKFSDEILEEWKKCQK